MNGVKMSLFIASALLAFSAPSHAAPLGGGFHGGSRIEFAARSAGTAFRTGTNIRPSVGFRPGFAFKQNRRFFHRDHRFFFQQFAWPVYWDPYYYPYDYYPGYYSDVEPYYNNEGVSNNNVPSSDPTVTAVQTRLTQLGYYNGPADGIYGPLTRDAVARYQTDLNLQVTGNLSTGTLQSLAVPGLANN